MADVVELIMASNHWISLLHEALGTARSRAAPRPVLAAVWNWLACLVQTHLAVMEEICYPAVLGAGPAGLAQLQQRIDDHNDIREAIAETRLQPPSGPLWWRAVTDALSACFDYLDREEHDLATVWQHHLGPARRRDLGRQCAAFVAALHRDLTTGSPGHGSACLCQRLFRAL